MKRTVMEQRPEAVLSTSGPHSPT